MRDPIRPDDVFLLEDGRMLRLIEIFALGQKDRSIVQFVDQEHETWIEFDSLNIEKNLGQSPSVLANFYSARSVHLRLNRINKV